MTTTVATEASRDTGSPRRPRPGGGAQRQTRAGWLFVTPMIVILGLFLVAPIGMALWVSVSDWTGRGSPFSGEVTTDRLLGILSGVPEVYGADPRPKKLEWMIRQAKSISGK